MDADASLIDRLVAQTNRNDVDAKIDAFTKLQVEFERGVEITDLDGLINAFKTCIRTSNLHLSAATLSALQPAIPLIVARHTQAPHGRSIPSPSLSSSTSSSSSFIDASLLRQCVNAFLPTGGLIERLGDKEKIQLKARESLVLLGGYAYRSGGASSMMSTGSHKGRGPETPLAIFERFLRENGFGSKVWKVREQSILTLVHIRKTHHTFPLRPYLSLLVECLEDTDAHVRDCARISVVELFTGPAVTDAARADLKKELTKKGVRKTIVDGVLSKLLGAGSGPQSRDGSEAGDVGPSEPKQYIPPSMRLQNRQVSSSSTPTAGPARARTASATSIPRPASRAAAAMPAPPLAEHPAQSSAAPTPPPSQSELKAVYIASARDMEQEFAGMRAAFEGKETEHNWAARDHSISRVRGMLKGGAHSRYFDVLLACLKDGFLQDSLKTVASLRTTVATNSCNLYCELAVALGPALDPFCDLLLNPLLKMAGFTKKITAQESQAAVTAIITHTSGTPRIFLPLLWNATQDKNAQARMYAGNHFKHYLEAHCQEGRYTVEHAGGVETFQKMLKKGLTDPNPGVKTLARQNFWRFHGIWPDEGAAMLGALDNTARKQLEKACPDPNIAAVVVPTAPPPSKKSSVAAAIAASRAKAKSIATSPPSLRHQATAATQAATQARRSSSPSLPRIRPSSPSSPSARPRIVSSHSIPASRTPASYSNKSQSPPPSPPAARIAAAPRSPESNRRRISSSSPLAPLAPNSNTLHRAMRTALPRSPAPESPSANRATTFIPDARMSIFMPENDDADDTLLLAQTIPVPDHDSDSDMDLMSFSSPQRAPPPPKSNSQTLSMSPKSFDSRPPHGFSNALSSESMMDVGSGQPIVEDAMRARAEQAESAAERLLELVEPEDDMMLLAGKNGHGSTLFGTNGHALTSPNAKGTKPPPLQPQQLNTPATPMNRTSSVMRQAALFKDSPQAKGHSPSLMDVLQQDHRQDVGWWLKRKAVVARAERLDTPESRNGLPQLKSYLDQLECGEVDIEVLQQVAIYCILHPSTEPSPMSGEFGSPFNSIESIPSLHAEMWDTDRTFDRLFKVVGQVLDPAKDEEVIEYGLILLWEMLDHQGPQVEGRETDVFAWLLQIRYCSKTKILEATNTIRDALTSKIDPVYGLTTMHASLKSFRTEPFPPYSNEDVRSSTFAFGLIALGKFILRLPAEIAEEEIPRISGTLVEALNDKSSLVIRESAAAVIIAAQVVIRDESQLFELLTGLADEKKNLLTYLFDKHGARGAATLKGVNRLEKEMRRLDTRTSMTPSQTL
ncbi:hypothetical protein CYLTODRAFT_490690 [Cylindrobasidium torrendii FP15055 ss-10]|uniref:TOG domain-containing protein n=1 Tax=Cylindrobasidium torrendii FP15055 ss-10 TaxID=1314674 RepID=A0A0D7B9W9_9AGAR|nr:hypothetical protein CYLTODRAFT_490690 [Cylindrobasidium torrendii FP15055 ss-10]